MRGRFFVLLLFGLMSGLDARTGLVQAQVAYDKPLSRSVVKEDGSRQTIKVDPYNKQVEEMLLDSKGGVIWRLVRELDDAFQPLKATKYDGQNRVISLHRYLCLRGRVEEEEILDSRETLVAKMVFYYDKKGRITRIDHFNADGQLVNSAKSTQGRGVEPVVREVSSGSAPTSPVRR
jgi:hypothetical protein